MDNWWADSPPDEQPPPPPRPPAPGPSLAELLANPEQPTPDPEQSFQGGGAGQDWQPTNEPLPLDAPVYGSSNDPQQEPDWNAPSPTWGVPQDAPVWANPWASAPPDAPAGPVGWGGQPVGDAAPYWANGAGDRTPPWLTDAVGGAMTTYNRLGQVVRAGESERAGGRILEESDPFSQFVTGLGGADPLVQQGVAGGAEEIVAQARDVQAEHPEYTWAQVVGTALDRSQQGYADVNAAMVDADPTGGYLGGVGTFLHGLATDPGTLAGGVEGLGGRLGLGLMGAGGIGGAGAAALTMPDQLPGESTADYEARRREHAASLTAGGLGAGMMGLLPVQFARGVVGRLGRSAEALPGVEARPGEPGALPTFAEAVAPAEVPRAAPLEASTAVVPPADIAHATQAVERVAGPEAAQQFAVSLPDAATPEQLHAALADALGSAHPGEDPGALADAATTAMGYGERLRGAAGRLWSGLTDAGPADARLGITPAEGSTRMYHGTGSAFDTPTADKFDPNGLFGPGYYLTSEPRVAGSYAQTRAKTALPDEMLRGAEDRIAQLEDLLSSGRITDAEHRSDIQAEIARMRDYFKPETGPNTRAIDVPEGLNLLDADAAAKPADLDHIRTSLTQLGERQGKDLVGRFDALVDDATASNFAAESTNHDVYRALGAAMQDAYPDVQPLQAANKALATMGYDGVKYEGGRRIPMRDADGSPIEHTAVAVFPESLPKLTNAISGTAGGIADQAVANPQSSQMLARGLGAATGAAVGQVGTDENTPIGERIVRGVIGAEAGTRAGAAVAGAGRARGALGITPGEGANPSDWDALGGGTTPAEVAARRADALSAGSAPAPPHEGIVGDATGATRVPSETAGGTGAVPTLPAPTRSFADYAAAADKVARNWGLGILGNPASVAGIAIKNAMELPQRLVSGSIAAVAGGHPGDVAAQTADLGRALVVDSLPRFWRAASAPLEQTASGSGYAGAADAIQLPGIISKPAEFMANFVRTHIGITQAISRGAGDMEIGRLARLDAATRGLTGAEADAHVGETIAEATALRDRLNNRSLRPDDAAALGASGDVSPLGVDIAQRGMAAGQRSTYTEQLGPFAQAFASRVRSVPVLGQVAAPFTHIPSNVAARNLEASPVGIVGTLLDLAQGKYAGATTTERLQGLGPTLPAGVSPLNERLARNAVGAGMVLTGYGLASSGIVVGSRPEDPKAAALFDQRGIPADSLMVPGGRYVPLFALGIPGLALKIGAELHSAQVEGRSVPAAAAGMAWSLIQDSPVKGTVELGKVLLNPEIVSAVGLHPDPTAGDRFVEGQFERWMPAGGLLRAGANALDPLERQVTGTSLPEKVGHAVESVTPGLRNTLPPRVDQTGRPRSNPRGGLEALDPFAGRQETQNPVLRVLDANGITVASGKQPTPTQPGEDPWTPGQLDLYHERLGRLVEQHVLATVGGPDRLRAVMDQPGTPASRAALGAAVDRAKTQLYADTNTTAALASIRPDALLALAQQHDRESAKAGRYLEFQHPALKDYATWLKGHGGGRESDARSIARYVAVRPR